jgi:hypothetical protein
MSPIFSFIERIAPGLYILLGLGAVVFFVRWRKARQTYLDANFELVRDLAGQQQNRMFIRWFAFFALAIAVVFIQQFLAPSLALNQQAAATATEIGTIFITTTSQPAGDVDIGDLVSGNSSDPEATPTVEHTPVGTIIPNAPPPQGCDSPRASLQIPTNGMRVFETIEVTGTANAENFASYKLELSGPGTSNIFAVISQSTTPSPDPGVLGQIVAMAFEPGEYQFRLTVFDTSNTLVAACLVNISISTPP